MSNKPQDPLIDSLMQLAVSAAPLIRRARDAGLFKSGTPEARAGETVVEATEVAPEPPPAAPKPAETADVGAEKAALQNIIVAQAMKITRLEAEIARLKAAGDGEAR